jgi:hypothetical protein
VNVFRKQKVDVAALTTHAAIQKIENERTRLTAAKSEADTAVEIQRAKIENLLGGYLDPDNDSVDTQVATERQALRGLIGKQEAAARALQEFETNNPTPAALAERARTLELQATLEAQDKMRTALADNTREMFQVIFALEKLQEARSAIYKQARQSFPVESGPVSRAAGLRRDLEFLLPSGWLGAGGSFEGVRRLCAEWDPNLLDPHDSRVVQAIAHRKSLAASVPSWGRPGMRIGNV